MNAHVHLGFAEMIQFMIMLIIAGFFFRTIEMKFPDSVMGKALAFLY